MRILFISNNFPPEVNAPATRLYEHAKQWVADGHEVEVITSAPHFPEGRVYEGYANRFMREVIEGIRVTRVPMYITANKGVFKRTISFVSFMLSVLWHVRRIQKRPEVVVATSPQFFAGIAGYFVGKRFGVPFVFEVRDLWPESIVAVGAMRRNAIIRFFERIEQFLYERAAHIIVVTDAFKKFIMGRGIPPGKISILKNGADLEAWGQSLDSKYLTAWRKRLDVEGKFVAAYIGTIGMAHRADVMLEAAQLCQDPEVVFMVVGGGAAREELEKRVEELKLPNFRLVEKVSKEDVKYIMGITDVSVVHLKRSPLFKTVIPSKIFEAMATGTPIVLGVEGEAKEIVERAKAGICVQPENPKDLVDAVLLLKNDPKLHAEMGRNGHAYVFENFDRKKIARKYIEKLRSVVKPKDVVLSSVDL